MKKKEREMRKWLGYQQKESQKRYQFGSSYRQEKPWLPQDDHHCLNFHISQYTQGETLKPETCEDMGFYHLPSEMQDISAYFQNIAANTNQLGEKNQYDNDSKSSAIEVKIRT